MQKIPILFIIFNRPETANKSFQPVQDYQPDELYIYADGPRDTHPNEKELCEFTRASVTNQINWKCNVHTYFQSKNFGCDNSIPMAIDWILQNEEWCIIIEDDCILHRDFFRFCELALPHYQNCNKVMYIAAFNPTPNLKKSGEAGFTNEVRIWGWATWKRAWNRMDIETLGWKGFNKLHLIKELGLFHGLMTWMYWQRAFGTNDNPWDNRWHFSVLSNKGLCLQPYVNLSRNSGTTISGVHYSCHDTDPYTNVPFGSIKWPISFPKETSISNDKVFNERVEFFRIRFLGLIKKIKRSFSHL